MPTYDYRCECGYECELRESIKADPTTLCPACKEEKMYRVMSGGIGGFVDRGITTIGKQAEVNSKKMGKYKLSEIAEKNPKKPEGVFTNKETRKKINKMTSPERIEKYIIEGK